MLIFFFFLVFTSIEAIIVYPPLVFKISLYIQPISSEDKCRHLSSLFHNTPASLQNSTSCSFFEKPSSSLIWLSRFSMELRLQGLILRWLR